MAAQPHPFDPRLSRRLDRIVIQIEAGPPPLQRMCLRLLKRACERTVPSYAGKAGAR